MTTDEHLRIPSAPFWLPRAFHAFLHRDFCVLWFGMLVSRVLIWTLVPISLGTAWNLTQTQAQGLLSLHPNHLYVFFFLGTVIFWFLGGIIADRIGRRVLLLLGQLVQFFGCAVLAFLMVLKLAAPVWILSSLFVGAMASAMCWSAYTSLAPDLVPENRRVAVFGLDNLLFSLPFLISTTAERSFKLGMWDWRGLILSGLGIIIVFAFFLLISSPHLLPEHPDPIWKDVSTGISEFFAGGHRLNLCLFVFIVSFLGSFGILSLPKLSISAQLDTGIWLSITLLLIWTSIAPAVGGIVAASLSPKLQGFRTLFALLPILGLSLILCVMIPDPAFALIPLFVIGAGLGMVYAIALNLYQSMVDDDLRGRLSPLFSISFFGGSAVGRVGCTEMASWIEVLPIACAAGGLLFIGGIILFALSPRTRQAETISE